MPCPKCGSIIVRFGPNNICPNCNGVKLLNRQAASFELFLNQQMVETKVNAILKKLEKNHFLLQLCWQREKFARSFFEKYQIFDMNEFLSSNLLNF
jgi:hypothetical protein